MTAQTTHWLDGTPGGTLLYELNDGDVTARLTPLGASLCGLLLPTRDGCRDVVLRYEGPDGYRDNPSNFGATVGRYANRIGGGRFVLDGTTHQLEVNNGPNCLHSGSANFARRQWAADAATVDGSPAVRFTLVSPDGEGGFPGTLSAAVTYRLSGGKLSIVYEATTDADTVVSLTNHTYWNLAGQSSGDARGHRVRINAGRRLEVDATVLPTGRLLDVSGTPFDFRDERAVDSRWENLTALGLNGYDHCFALDTPGLGTVAAELASPVSGVRMSVRTTLPGCQLYTAAHLDGSESNAGYDAYAGVCLECQMFPDSPNHPNFPSTLLRAGETIRHETTHTFSTD